MSAAARHVYARAEPSKSALFAMLRQEVAAVWAKFAAKPRLSCGMEAAMVCGGPQLEQPWKKAGEAAGHATPETCCK